MGSVVAVSLPEGLTACIVDRFNGWLIIGKTLVTGVGIREFDCAGVEVDCP